MPNSNPDDSKQTPLSASLRQSIDEHLHNNLSPGLSTNLSTTAAEQGGLARGYLASSDLGVVAREQATEHEQAAAREQALQGAKKVNGNTALQQCVVAELDKYFAMLEGHPPNDLYKLVIAQVETALFSYVLEACGNNQSRAAEYLGVSRGTLRNRIVDLSLD